MFGPLVSQSFGELGHATFRRCVSANHNATLKAKYRRDIDDLPAALAFDHVLACELAETKDTRQIHLEHGGPIFVCKLNRGCATNNACVVDHNVETSKMIDRFFDEMFGSLWLAQVPGYRMGLFDLLASCVRRMRVAVAGYSSAGLAKRDGNSSAEAG